MVNKNFEFLNAWLREELRTRCYFKATKKQVLEALQAVEKQLKA